MSNHDNQRALQRAARVYQAEHGCNYTAALRAVTPPLPGGLCGADGGRGLGAGHVCACNSQAGHESLIPPDMVHGCGCGAMWRDDSKGGE